MAQFEQARRSLDRDTSSHHQSLAGRICIVGDGSKTVGSAIALELLREGATVIAPLRTQEQVERLLDDCRGAPLSHLFPVIADVGDDEAFAEFVTDAVDKHGAIDHAISCFGSFWQGGELTEQPLVEFNRVIAESAACHFVFAKHVLPALKPSHSSSLLFISEGAGKHVISPDAGLYTVGAAAVFGIILAAQAQYADSPVRINEMRLYMVIKRHTDMKSNNFQDFFGKKAYSNRKVGKLTVDALMASARKERIVVTPLQLDGEALTV